MAVRKDRSDQQVGAFEKKHGMPAGTIRNADGSDTRSDKKIGTIRKAAAKKAVKVKKAVKKSVKAVKKAVKKK